MSTATINVRLPQELKRGGDEVLRRAGVTVTQAIRSLYGYMDEHQDIPPFIGRGTTDAKRDAIAQKRAALASLAGIANVTDAAIGHEDDRYAHLVEKHMHGGIR
jgi:DNA-damage-inducible protein J